MDSEHRKIELQSPGDLTYIQSQIRTAARQKLDLHLPSVSSDAAEPDDLRRKTEELVDAFVNRVLEGMRGNIAINGMDVVADGAGDGMGMEGVEGMGGGAGAGAAAAEEEFEPWDSKLRDRLQETVQKRDALVAKIAAHRRQTPALASARFKEQFVKDMEGGERLRVQNEERAREMELHGADVDGSGGESLGLGLSRQDEVERNWERAVTGLQRLNKGLPETRARLERCGDVVGYLGGKGGVA
jgi:kinetochor protein Mis14/NSL1